MLAGEGPAHCQIDDVAHDCQGEGCSHHVLPLRNHRDHWTGKPAEDPRRGRAQGCERRGAEPPPYAKVLFGWLVSCDLTYSNQKAGPISLDFERRKLGLKRMNLYRSTSQSTGGLHLFVSRS